MIPTSTLKNRSVWKSAVSTYCVYFPPVIQHHTDYLLERDGIVCRLLLPWVILFLQCVKSPLQNDTGENYGHNTSETLSLRSQAIIRTFHSRWRSFTGSDLSDLPWWHRGVDWVVSELLVSERVSQKGKSNIHSFVEVQRSKSCLNHCEDFLLKYIGGWNILHCLRRRGTSRTISI